MAGQTVTIVKRVTVGVPIRTVTSGAFSVTNLAGINVAGVKEGSMLVYDAAASEFRADSDMSSVYTEINGGTF
jgi:hypothetical protein|tara:strand:- start:2 stop:220 length:219 start_codon:yes stop_codon:yes gene_type:complete